MKYLIVQLGSKSEVLLSTPLIRVLKTQIDEAEIAVLTNHNELLAENPYIDQFIQINDVKQMETYSFSAVIDLSNSGESRKLSKSLSRKQYQLNRLGFDRALLVNLKINRLPKKHLSDRMMELVTDLGVKIDHLGCDFFIPEKDEVERDWLPETHQKEFVVFALSANAATQKLPKSRLIELCDKINKPVVLIGGAEEETLAEELVDFFQKRHINEPYEEGLKELGKKTVLFNGCGKFSFNQSASLIKKSIAVFTYDSVYMHVAAAFNRDVYTIWGSTIAEYGEFPYQTKFSIFENRRLSCRPCSVKPQEKCPLGHFKCMHESIFDFYIP